MLEGFGNEEIISALLKHVVVKGGVLGSEYKLDWLILQDLSMCGGKGRGLRFRVQVGLCLYCKIDARKSLESGRVCM